MKSSLKEYVAVLGSGLLLALFFITIILLATNGCEFRYGRPTATPRPGFPPDDTNCMVEFTPRSTPACNNP